MYESITLIHNIKSYILKTKSSSILTLHPSEEVHTGVVKFLVNAIQRFSQKPMLYISLINSGPSKTNRSTANRQACWWWNDIIHNGHTRNPKQINSKSSYQACHSYILFTGPRNPVKINGWLFITPEMEFHFLSPAESSTTDHSDLEKYIYIAHNSAHHFVNNAPSWGHEWFTVKNMTRND